MAQVTVKTADEIRTDLTEVRKALDSERERIEKAIVALTPAPKHRGPGRPRKVAA